MRCETLTEVVIARIRIVNFHTALEAMLQTQGHKVHFPVFSFFCFIIQYFPKLVYTTL